MGKEVEKEIHVRLDTAANYRDSKINSLNRLEKREDEYLEKLLGKEGAAAYRKIKDSKIDDPR